MEVLGTAKRQVQQYVVSEDRQTLVVAAVAGVQVGSDTVVPAGGINAQGTGGNGSPYDCNMTGATVLCW
jgi:hypothetical protein